MPFGERTGLEVEAVALRIHAAPGRPDVADLTYVFYVCCSENVPLWCHAAWSIVTR
jgi:hypothetical protein